MSAPLTVPPVVPQQAPGGQPRQAFQAVLQARAITTQALLSLLQPGQAFGARVVPPSGNLPAGTLTLATPAGNLDLRGQAPLPPGTQVRVDVQRAAGGEIQLRFTPQPQTGTATSQRTGTAPATAQPAAGGTPAQAAAPSGQAIATPRSALPAPAGQAGNAASAPGNTAPPAAPPSPAPGQATAQTAATAAVNQAVRAALASQSGLAPLFANLATLAKPQSAAALPEPARGLIAKLLGLSLDGDRGPTAADLARAVSTSGLFQEAGQARGQPQTGDLKALLAQMRAALGDGTGRDASRADAERPTPPQARPGADSQRPAQPTLSPDMPADDLAARLMQQVDGALSRIKLMQFASLPDQTDSARAPDMASRDLVLELPLMRDGRTGIMQFRISRERESATGQAAGAVDVWRLRFGLDFNDTGPVHAAVTLRGQRIGVAIWAEDGGMATRLRADLDGLERALEEAALEVDMLAVRQGRPPADTDPPDPGRYMDEVS